MLPKSVTPFFSSLFKNINNMQIQLKKNLPLSRWETLFSLLFRDSLLDYSYKNAICRDGQTCWGGNKNLSGMFTHSWNRISFSFLTKFSVHFKRLS